MHVLNKIQSLVNGQSSCARCCARQLFDGEGSHSMMTTLTAWKFQYADTAEVAARTLRELARENLLVVYDAATVEWQTGAARPMASQLYPITDVGALGTIFWGRLFGLLFCSPQRDDVDGELSHALTDQGIDDRFITRVRDGIMPGTSALFVMSPDAVVDRIREAFAGDDAPELTFTNLQDGTACGRITFS
ncbi:DUF1269 domain-containing protein [Promicromonospora sp. NPDC057138]|uniref:DUF1269 domain-containing protein n=1 Tax=Promicromonospora sp. NPDC057138 TaxID=3346031 RepID=UPI003637BB54